MPIPSDYAARVRPSSAGVTSAGDVTWSPTPPAPGAIVNPRSDLFDSQAPPLVHDPHTPKVVSAPAVRLVADLEPYRSLAREVLEAHFASPQPSGVLAFADQLGDAGSSHHSRRNALLRRIAPDVVAGVAGLAPRDLEPDDAILFDFAERAVLAAHHALDVPPDDPLPTPRRGKHLLDLMLGVPPPARVSRSAQAYATYQAARSRAAAEFFPAFNPARAQRQERTDRAQRENQRAQEAAQRSAALAQQRQEAEAARQRAAQAATPTPPPSPSPAPAATMRADLSSPAAAKEQQAFSFATHSGMRTDSGHRRKFSQRWGNILLAAVHSGLSIKRVAKNGEPLGLTMTFTGTKHQFDTFIGAKNAILRDELTRLPPDAPRKTPGLVSDSFEFRMLHPTAWAAVMTSIINSGLRPIGGEQTRGNADARWFTLEGTKDDLGQFQEWFDELKRKLR